MQPQIYERYHFTAAFLSDAERNYQQFLHSIYRIKPSEIGNCYHLFVMQLPSRLRLTVMCTYPALLKYKSHLFLNIHVSLIY